jgi:hypothetical protein
MLIEETESWFARAKAEADKGVPRNERIFGIGLFVFSILMMLYFAAHQTGSTWLSLYLFEYRQTNQTKEDIRKDPKGSMISFPGRCLSKLSFGSLVSEYCRLEATSAPTSAIIPRSGFIDSDRSSFHIGSVQFCHRFLCFLIRGHLDESKSSRCSR